MMMVVGSEAWIQEIMSERRFGMALYKASLFLTVPV